jgi:hypothetical protein
LASAAIGRGIGAKVKLLPVVLRATPSGWVPGSVESTHEELPLQQCNGLSANMTLFAVKSMICQRMRHSAAALAATQDQLGTINL